MKHDPLSSILLALSLMLFATPVLAQDAGADTDSPTTGQTSETGAAHPRRLTGLDLTDAQMAQIKQIRASTTDKKERWKQIMAILTPEQKSKMRKAAQERWAQREAAKTPTSTTAQTSQ